MKYKDPERLISRESSWLEFKESFGWHSLAKYLKTSAAYANTKGGYIVFGVADRPHILKGLSGKGLECFEALDPEQLGADRLFYRRRTGDHAVGGAHCRLRSAGGRIRS